MIKITFSVSVSVGLTTETQTFSLSPSLSLSHTNTQNPDLHLYSSHDFYLHMKTPHTQSQGWGGVTHQGSLINLRQCTAVWGSFLWWPWIPINLNFHGILQWPLQMKIPFFTQCSRLGDVLVMMDSQEIFIRNAETSSSQSWQRHSTGHYGREFG